MGDEFIVTDLAPPFMMDAQPEFISAKHKQAAERKVGLAKWRLEFMSLKSLSS